MIPILFLVLVLSAVPGPSVAGDTAYRIVRPTDEAHELLPKTCRVCHKDDDQRFLIVVAPDDDALEEALRRLVGAGGAAGPAPARPTNPHAAIACLFCHLESPGEDQPADTMRFRTLDEDGASRAEVERSCRVCHPGDASDHPRVLGRADPLPGMGKAGLPVPNGRVLCTTCHDMHDQNAGPADVRRAYQAFAARDPASFVHGNRAGCRACHPTELAPDAEPVFQEVDPARRCTGCHTADHARIHPVGVAPTTDTYPLDFLGVPLDDDGRITCSTCHDEVCTGRIDPRNPRFLRGGPYAVPTDFCYRCHPKAGPGGLSPHDQLDDDGRVVRTTCTFCHRTAPTDPGGADFRPEDLLYLRSPVELCMGCHDPGPHPSVNHLVPMPSGKLAKLRRYEERHQVKFPLGPDDQVVCTTCHNPHAKGVLRGRAALGAGELGSWRVPSFAELCTPCHARYD